MTTDDDNSILMTVAETVAALKLSRSTVERLIKVNRLATVRFGRSVRITRESVAALVASKAREAA
ncbi:hypothetical protein GCM10011349_11890 [Novosphingobium indicum]|uniref:Helix-turn-helix domain-containing protein n=1 Tax=Novosphingobium indicum TaxID=462949 RepID=A0ABQ2JEY3_9SPHN|nr:helix-turn-helix domain-containing protein [Novosphingobium indicum]GGN45606.1 hypothetical protein GCM10011349_11890 [Novosphingobium indicum]